MKKAITSTCFLPLLVLGISQSCWSMTEFDRATTYGADFKTTYVVVDDIGRPVSNALFNAWLGLELNKDGGVPIYGHTDRDGCFVLHGKTTGDIRYRIIKEGYYTTGARVELYDTDEEENAVKNGCWQPYGIEKTVTLKRIINATVKAFHMDYMQVPAFDKWMGFDLERFAFCAPYGNGERDDMLLRFVFNQDPNVKGKTYSSMELTFTNNPSAGAYMLKKDKWSEFQSCYEADTNNTFALTSFRYERIRTREEVFKKEQFPEDSYIVFRTRTTVDEVGKLKSAHYGKIYGEWNYPRHLHFGGTLFNSTPNDPNLEEEETAVNAHLQVKGIRERGK